MRDEFVDVRIPDNFYQTSSFYPMPVVLISTSDENGETNLEPYSLVFPYLIADKHGMVHINSGKDAASRIDPDRPWQDGAYAKLQRVPRVFLNKVVNQIIQMDREDGVTEITPEYLDQVRDKRNQEKSS